MATWVTPTSSRTSTVCSPSAGGREIECGGLLAQVPRSSGLFEPAPLGVRVARHQTGGDVGGVVEEGFPLVLAHEGGRHPGRLERGQQVVDGHRPNGGGGGVGIIDADRITQRPDLVIGMGRHGNPAVGRLQDPHAGIQPRLGGIEGRHRRHRAVGAYVGVGIGQHPGAQE